MFRRPLTMRRLPAESGSCPRLRRPAPAGAGHADDEDGGFVGIVDHPAGAGLASIRSASRSSGLLPSRSAAGQSGSASTMTKSAAAPKAAPVEDAPAEGAASGDPQGTTQ
jgi:hypothetical protein